MEQNNVVYILPYNEWKAYRVISFTIEGVQARLVYKRILDVNKIEIIDTPDPFYKGKTNRTPILPIDEIDQLLLSWIKIIDKNANIDAKLFIVNTAENSFNLTYEGLPKSILNLFALPSFGSQSIDELFKLEGQEFTQYSRNFRIYTYGNIPNKNHLSITGYYDINTKDLFEELMIRLRKEIQQ